jgi:Rrf2 family protein
MLALTRKTGYALAALSYLARLPDGRVASARRIAERFGAPASLMMNVLKELAAAGCVESVRGARGGYRLAVAPEGLTLARIVTVLEGPVRLAECVREGRRGHETRCQIVARCPVCGPIRRVSRRVKDLLEAVTLAELIAPAAAPAKEPAPESTAAPARKTA